MTDNLPGPVAAILGAMNDFDLDGFMAPFSDDALVNDAHRQFWGTESIRAWAAKEIIGDKVTLTATEVRDHYGDVIVTGIVEGNFDRANLPPVVILAFYFTVRGDKVVQLVVLPVAGPKEIGT
ncbi:MAG: hypothetical protein JWR80_7618 [Bradyrhizobium sp.]|nr:hypothetical protein [Bradyrhizobium sp.]